MGGPGSGAHPKYDRDLIRELYRELDGNAQEVAAIVGCHYRTVDYHTKDLRKPRFDPEVIRELYKQSGNAERVASEVGCNVRTVHRYTYDLRELHGPGRVNPDTLAWAKELLDDRAGYRETSLTTGIAQDTLARHFPDMGLTPQEAGSRGIMQAALNYLTKL
jgi:hypothetical protein